ncbi:uncharacterized protein H6S33_001762 [Morchella sextelata]|uniref:uncharacterized protein n=1 Tax=Morchella sextelata TaxID=1174677 RepID=UPI001D056D20|nr:uncharacterized protein H6S33_001762 [Morchella sextelata]KAH0608628.1 hypothetical protein H6S33_001762 [Morchella sextelata]
MDPHSRLMTIYGWLGGLINRCSFLISSPCTHICQLTTLIHNCIDIDGPGVSLLSGDLDRQEGQFWYLKCNKVHDTPGPGADRNGWIHSNRIGGGGGMIIAQLSGRTVDWLSTYSIKGFIQPSRQCASNPKYFIGS